MRDNKLTTDEIRTYYSTCSLNETSKRLHVGTTLLKKICRKFGIKRWPYRQIKSIRTLLYRTKEMLTLFHNCSPERAVLQVTCKELENLLFRLIENPNTHIPHHVRDIRQVQFKINHLSKKPK
mmetsp:Transcript_15730/g.53701  ORF Transcript_15730/g.53701 Transcript_15730/m.53701 type:complete len:123 (-) Transcript_15730:262-630(-)